MEKNLEIKKLADIVVWADNLITSAGYYEEKYNDSAATAYCSVKAHELWKIKTAVLESMERHAVYTNALNQDIADKAAKINLLEKEIEGRKKAFNDLKEEMATRYIAIETHNDICKTYENKVEELNRNWSDDINTNNDLIERYEKKFEELEKQNKYLKKELNQTCTCKELDLKGHQSRETALVNALADKNDEIKRLKEENFKLSGRVDTDFVNKLIQETDYYKEQERIRTDQLRATESKVDQLYKELEGYKEENSYLKKVSKDKNDIIKKAYARYVDEACKGREEIMNECYEKLTKDNTGYTGFKQYTLRALEAQEGNEKKTKEFICNTAEIIFYDKRKEETEIKGIHRMSSGRYPWGADVNDIPCSVSRRIKEIAVRLRSEVDKKRIVDIGEGAEKILGVSRELFDAAIKALVDDGYQEIIGRIPKATNSYVYMDMHVLATPDVETRETANAENIKSLDFDIPCGEDAIE